MIFEVGRGNRTADPLLTDVAAYDLHPRRGSPAPRSADATLAYPYDAPGQLRPAAPAIGALEPAGSWQAQEISHKKQSAW